jgi:hypothetical protein
MQTSGEYVSTLDEIKNIVNQGVIRYQDDAECCQYFLRTWNKSVVPNTPPTASPTFHLTVDAAAFLLRSIATTAESSLETAHTLIPILVHTWPSIWAFLRRLYKRTQKARISPHTTNLFAAQEEYRLISDVIIAFTIHGPSELYTVVTDTPGVISMVAAMWAGEANDDNRTYGFLAAGLTEPFITDPRGVLTNEMIKACGGRPKDVVSAAINRISSNLHQSRPDYTTLIGDISISLGHLRITSSALHNAFVSASRFVIIMVNVMAHLLSSSCSCPVVEQFSLLCLCTAFITHQMQSPLGAHRVRQALDTDVLQLLLRSSRLCHETLPDHDRFNSYCDLILQDILPRYFVHQSLLSKVSRSLASSKTGNLVSQMRRGEPFETSWSKFTELANKRLKQYKEYKVSPGASFVCGNPEVSHAVCVHHHL